MSCWLWSSTASPVSVRSVTGALASEPSADHRCSLACGSSERTQQPVLRTALGLTSLFADVTPQTESLRRHILAMCLKEVFGGVSGDSPVSKAHRMVALLDRFGDQQLNKTLLTKHGFNLQYGNFPAGNGTAAFLDELKTFIQDSVTISAYSGKPFEFATLTAIRITSGEELKQRNGLAGLQGRGMMLRLAARNTRRQPGPIGLTRPNRHLPPPPDCQSGSL